MCGIVIEGTYYQLNDNVYCEAHYLAHMGDTCAKCDTSIEGEHVKITGSSFHPACFNCEVRSVFLLARPRVTLIICSGL